MTHLRDLLKFSAMVALFGILSDAVLGHALLWENDPYWTYWITKTFLIGTVFIIGTAWLGVGAIRGAVITLIHTLVLTVYYWSFSPVGLPDAPMWLDLQHTWITGVPIHFGVIYIGYLAALWFWRQAGEDDFSVSSRLSLLSGPLLSSVLAVIASGLLSSFFLGEFVGVTWFVTRFLVVFPLILFLWAYLRPSGLNIIASGFVLTLILIAYSHYLSPLGIPGTWRIFENITPMTKPRWLGYEELWLVQFPIYLVVFTSAIWASFRTSRGKE